MRKRNLVLLAMAIAIQPSFCFAQTKSTPVRAISPQAKLETSHLVFVTEYIRELAALEKIRADAEEENKRDSQDGTLKFGDLIHTSTIFELELGSYVRTLRDMRLKEPFDEMIPGIITCYERKIQIWRRLGQIGGSFIGGPKEGIDYSELAAEVPKLRGELDFIDQTLFEASSLVFATLIDAKADSKGHANHLIITKAEKATLVEKINVSFGAELDQKNQNYTVSAATVLRAYLNKDFLCSDEPWE
jgi:hypothetical protein